MSDHDSNSGGGMGILGGIGALVLAAVAGLARFGDDALRVFGRHADDVGRGVMHGGDDIGRGAFQHADDLGRGAMQHGNEIGGIPKLSDPSRIVRGADDAAQQRVYVPSSLLRPSTYGQGDSSAQPADNRRKP